MLKFFRLHRFDLDNSLTVPAESVKAYMSSTGWNDFWTIEGIKSETSGIDDIRDNDSTKMNIDGTTLHIADAGRCQVMMLTGVVKYRGNGGCDIQLAPGICIVAGFFLAATARLVISRSGTRHTSGENILAF